MSVTGPFSEAGVFWATDPWYYDGSTYIGMVPNSTAAAANNTAVLQYLIYLAQSSNPTSGACSNPATNPPWAATILIPGHTSVPPPVGSGGPPPDQGAVYYLATPASPPIPGAAIDIGCQYPIRILGTGNVQLSMLDNGTMFYVNTKTGDDSNIGGLTFEDLHLRYSSSESGAGVAIHVAAATSSTANDGAQNVRIVRCVFTDCLIGAWFEEALQCSMLQCTVDIVKFSGTGVQVGGPNNGFEKPFGKDIFITDCIFEVASGAPTGNVGLNLIAAEHVRLKSVRFDGFDTGILINPGYAAVGQTPSTFNVVRCYFEDVNCFAGLIAGNPGPAGIGLKIQPQNSTSVGQLCFVGCTFEPGSDTGITSTSPGPGILIDANGGFIDTVRFVSCYSNRWTGPGLSIGQSGGTGTIQNVEVLGGMYAGNNLSSGSSAYGIAIYGSASAVRLIGVSCVGQYKFIQHDNSSMSPQQNVGIYISGATNVLVQGCDVRENATNGIVVDGSTSVVTNVLIRDCNVTGFALGYSYAINVVGAATNLIGLEITNCGGYNDQGVPLSGTALAGTVSISNSACRYWGPIEFYAALHSATSITAMTIDGTNTHLPGGSIYLAPGETGAVSWTPTGNTIYLTIIGK